MTIFNYRKFFRSFFYATRGLKHLIAREQNARVHSMVALLVIALAIYLQVSSIEAAMLFFAIALVFTVEITNTAIEKLLDVVHPESHNQIAFIKDALAGAVLIAAIAASVVGILIFLPYLNLSLIHI